LLIESILDHYILDDKQKIEVKRLLDKFNIVRKKGILIDTDFLDPYILAIGENILKSAYDDLNYISHGGYESAERKILRIFPRFYNGNLEEFPFTIINISGIKAPNHRNILGAILGLGIKREKVGDILISKDKVQVIVISSISDYILYNLTSLGRDKVIVNLSDRVDIKAEEEFTTVKTTVKSLRLDAVCAAGFNESRNKVVNDIKANKLKVNHRPILTPSYLLKEGDLISYRGKGRIILVEIIGFTRKDRINIVIKKPK